jgi:ABC-type bacteriocin/lantibiotic exporter with double-glycine peptidase domain
MHAGFKEKSIEISQVINLYNDHYHHYFRDSKKNFNFLGRKEGPLYKILFRYYRYPLMITGALLLAADIITICLPSALTPLLEILKRNNLSQTERAKGVLITLGLVLLTVADAALISAYYQRSYSIGLDLKAKLTTALIGKSQKLYKSPFLGKLNNLLTKDISAAQSFLPYLHFGWSCPLQVILCSWSIYGIFGLPSTLVGILTLGFCTLIIPFTTRRIIGLRKEYQSVNDQRINLHSYWLNNLLEIRWGPLSPQINTLVEIERSKEVSILNQTNILRIIMRSANNLSPMISFLVTIFWFSFISSEKISSSQIIKAITLFNLLKLPLQWIPSFFTRFGEVSTSLYRIEDAFDTQNCEIVDSKLNNSNPTMSQKTGLLIVKDKKDFEDLLNFSLEKQLNFFYSPQTIWIQKNSTVLENIIISSIDRFDQLVYEKSLEISRLKPEVSDADLVMNLSQGQKQRLLLARAFYSQKPILFLEEPLNGLDKMNRDLIIDKFFNFLAERKLIVVYSREDSIFNSESRTEIEKNSLLNLNQIQSSSPFTPHEISFTEKKLSIENLNFTSTTAVQKFIGLLSGAFLILISQQFFKTLFYKTSQTSLVFSHSSFPQLAFWAGFHSFSFFLGSWMVFKAFSSLGGTFFFKINSLLLYSPNTRFLRTVGEELKNCLTIDLYEAEYKLPEVIRSFLVLLISTLSTVGLMIYAMPILLIPCSVLLVVLGFLSYYFRRPLIIGNELVARSNSRLLGLLNDYQTGHSTVYYNPEIRKNLNMKFKQELLHLNSSNFFTFSLPGWLELRLSFISASMISMISFAGLFFGGSSVLLGIAMAKSISLTKNFHSLIRKLSELEEYRVHIDRLQMYSSNGQVKEAEPNPKMIQRRETDIAVEFRDLTLKYGQSKAFTRSVPIGAKVLIQGQSGCGKSTILLSILDPSLIKSGTIFSNSDLKFLYLTNNPVIFDGLTINEQLTNASEESISFYLNRFQITSKKILGSDLSIEQKAIVAFLRVHFMQSKHHIVLLDEIVSGLSPAFKELVEEIILTEWKETTVFYISHTTNNQNRFTHHWNI